MDKVTIKQALEDQEYNAKLSVQQPEKQKEFEAEHMYSNPNDYEAMKELYEAYGYKYSRSLWALQQVSYNDTDDKN
jgi:hypothetical protein